MSAISFNEFKAKYRFDCQLSQGSFGRVCRILEVETGRHYALKKVTVKRKEQLEDIQNEIRLLSRFRHPFVVQIKETYNIQIKSGFAKPIWEVGLVMQLAKCSLEQLIRMKKPVGNFQFLIEQTAGLIKILFILQKQNIAHRDIKPANILIFEGPENGPHWKLADFGLSVDLNKTREEESFAGSFQYASPKLKRKFKYPNLKIKTNPFKDDVYSLGVTLLETITCFRSYNAASYQKLREVCPDERLVSLVDMMLEQDEDKRPCFKQLMMLMQKDFKIQIDSIEDENSRDPNLPKFRKISSNDYRNNDPISDKTVIKKSQRQLQKNLNSNQKPKAKKTIFQVGKPVQCVANLDGVVMCGCDNGEVVFVKNGEIVQGGFIHKRGVSQLFVDAKGNIWSVGGDNTIKKWSKNSLIKGLISSTKQQKIDSPRLLEPPHKKTKLTLQPSPHYEQLDLPFNHPHGISCIFAIDKENFAVGYYDGYVYVRWGGGEYHGKMFTRPVTGVRLGGVPERLWFCGLDGQVKILKCKELVPQNRLFFKQGHSFINLHLHLTNPEPCLNLLTLSGRQLLLKPSLQPLFETPATPSTVLTSLQTSNNCYLLMQNGELIDSNEEKIVQLGLDGWNCLAVSMEREIVVGSFGGWIAVVEL